ncbi:bifunctional folylpolyglutamate synthase/dihydrofolate synthase [Glycomyces sp. L485]|uniref:bifunctional folylpolyglutamate synthase/dihydrofolate synthase n=1 Tax=Glycomyces sp. L485 TaxID=2909235 RepID=UPI001F4BB157|nr:folylpolyglutamate synthase/dihydrofolate synthase family protein [Glycomyces sp. L485]MCH7232529.1 bifunctional folylpolyglutamate synthase/dihydrofolate synthase [Glycomyces sp. L485]
MRNAELAQVEAALEARGFSRWDFTLDRIKALLDLMGDPQRAFRTIHITGTNGKTSTTRMIERLLRGHNLRTGMFTSPHLVDVTERICIDGEPIAPDRLAAQHYEIAPLADLVDAGAEEKLTYFEMTVALAMGAFADTPIDVAVVEVGLGGETDSTNILNAPVAVITPIAIDHTKWLGDTLAEIATMKAGIVHEGSTLVTSTQERAAMEPLLRRAQAVGAKLVPEGRGFEVTSREVAVGGQLLTIETRAARYEDLFLPLHGEYQAHNAALALAAVEVLLGAGEPKALDAQVVGEAFADFTSPGRLEVVRTAPTVVLDAAHNPAGMEAMTEAVGEEFNFRKLVAVVGMLADKEVDHMLELLEPIVDEIVITKSNSERAMPAATLAKTAREIFGPERVIVQPHMSDAIARAIELAEEAEDIYESGGGVLITGSVFTVADARKLLVRRG